MPANRFNGFTDYGVGIGLRVPHYEHIFSEKPVVDWFEIISENYMVDGGRPLKVLDQILEQYRVVQHGVSMYFGSAQPLDREHLKRLKELRSAPGLHGYPTIFAGEASTAAILMIFSRYLIPSKLFVPQLAASARCKTSLRFRSRLKMSVATQNSMSPR
jgi:hypothetical protein